MEHQKLWIRWRCISHHHVKHHHSAASKDKGCAVAASVPSRACLAKGKEEDSGRLWKSPGGDHGHHRLVCRPAIASPATVHVGGARIAAGSTGRPKHVQ
jgi:hypothetical protein